MSDTPSAALTLQALEALSCLSKSSSTIRIERRIFTVDASGQEAAAEAAMTLTRLGTWQLNLHATGMRKAGKKTLFDYVVERVIK